MGQGLLNYFLRGLNSGAISEEEALRTGLSLDELRTRSFVKIIKAAGSSYRITDSITQPRRLQ